MRFVAVLLLLLGCGVGPGFVCLRRLRWFPLEKLCGSIGLSIFILYLTAFIIFILHLPAWSYFVVTAICVAVTATFARELFGLFLDRQVRAAGVGFSVLLLFGVAAISLVRQFSGGVCAWDWLEHYERTLYFLHASLHFTSSHHSFLSGYHLAARPPLMNLVAAHFLAQAGQQYLVFQIVFLFLGLLTFFPLCLMTQAFAGRLRFSLALLVGFLLASPVFWWNLTWTWTKQLTCFYVLFGLWMYVAGWRKKDSIRIGAAFVALSAAFLVHFSAGPYALFLLLHYLLFIFPRQQYRLRKALITGLLCAALLATWFAPSLLRFGAPDTFASNTTAAAFEASGGVKTAKKIVHNLIDTTVPFPVRLSRAQIDSLIGQRSGLGYFRDYALSIYLGNCIFSMGCVGGLLVCWLLLRKAKADLDYRFNSSLRTFWCAFVIFCWFLGIAVHPTVEDFGVWNICGQPLTLLGIAFLAASYKTLPKWLQRLALVGCGIDFAVGVWLHFALENRPGGELLSNWALRNAADKASANLTYLGDHVAGLWLLSEALLLSLFCGTFYRMLLVTKQD